MENAPPDGIEEAPPGHVVKQKVTKKRKVKVTQEDGDAAGAGEQPAGDVPDDWTAAEELHETPVEGTGPPEEEEAEPPEGTEPAVATTPEDGTTCPHCGARLVVRTSIRPTIVRCGECQSTVTLR